MFLPKLEATKLTLEKGCTFFQETLELSNRRFTNLYWLESNLNRYHFGLQNSITPRPVVNFLRSFAKTPKGNKVLGGINTGQFFLSDDKVKPKIPSYNLLFSAGKILQFPANKRPTIIERDGKFSMSILNAEGRVRVGKEMVNWVGSASKSTKRKYFTVYGSIDIDIVRQPLKDRSRRVINKKSLKIGCKENDILICFENVRGNMTVTKITRSAHLNHYSFIFKGSSKNLGEIKPGDKIKDFEIDGILFSKNTNAVSCVLPLPLVKTKLRNTIKEFLLSSPNGQYFVLSKKYIKSWSVILKAGNKIIFFINDGNPNIYNENGLNLTELYDLLLNKFNFDSAFICDAGQSSKLCIKRRKDYLTYGNMHYLDYTNMLKPRRRALFGRSIPSALVVYR